MPDVIVGRISVSKHCRVMALVQNKTTAMVKKCLKIHKDFLLSAATNRMCYYVWLSGFLSQKRRSLLCADLYISARGLGLG